MSHNHHHYFQIDKFSHHFAFSRITPRGRELLESFIPPYVQWAMVKENRRWTRKPVKVFAARLEDKTKYRFHIEQYTAFMKHLADKQVHESCYAVNEHVANFGLHVNMNVREGWVPRDYQEPIITYATNFLPLKRKLIEIQTGKGKTSIAMFSISELGQRLAIFIKPMYMEKWVEDVQKICDVKPEEIIEVKGSDQLMHLIALAKQNALTAKVFIFSNRTIQNWITLYEKVGDEGLQILGYDCLPHELLSTLKVGIRLIDEVHQDFHLNFKIDLYTHVEWSISLSATLVADDPFLTRMYELAYPKSMRYSGLAYHKYIKSYSWIYRFNRPDQIRTHEFGATAYSHNAFEKSLIKRPQELEAYVKMINECVKQTYLQNYKPGDKLLIYCSSINMCTQVAYRLKKLHPNKDVRRYVEEDPYNNLLKSDICVSTLLSAGTGHDIPGLTTVILTSAVSSSQSNIQGFGRLREIVGRDVSFIYFVCSDFQKHIDYHEKKKLILNEKALTYNSISYPISI